MLYLVAFIVLVILAVLLWKAFGPKPGAVPTRRVKGPDDDPDFLWKMNREAHRKQSEGPDAAPTDPVT